MVRHLEPISSEKKQHFGSWLNAGRKRLGLSYDALAKKIGAVSAAGVRQHCLGINYPVQAHLLPAYERILGEKCIYPGDSQPLMKKEFIESHQLPKDVEVLLAALMVYVKNGDFELIIRSCR
jgi:hypothetical protein